MNAKISNVNGGDKSLETKHVRETKKEMGSTVSIVMFSLDFKERRPFSLGLLGRCWFSALAGTFVKSCIAKWPKVTKLLLQVT